MVWKSAGSLIIVGAYISFMNWWSVYASYRERRFHSSVPLIGAILLGPRMALIPASRHYAWFAPILDYGTIIFLLAVPMLAKEFWRSRFKG